MCGAELMALPEGVQKVAAFLEGKGHPHSPVMLDAAARTAQQAADALGVDVGQIAKSIVFRRKPDDVAVLVVTSGDRRVDERKLEALICPDGTRIGRADAAFVKATTGFSIGGVAPLAHAGDVLTLIDRSLMRFDAVWAAAGHPHAVFKLIPKAFDLLTDAPLVDVAVDSHDDKTIRQNAIDLIVSRHREISPGSDIIPSPCISVCRISADSGLCEGCFRTLDEITTWSGLPVAGKRTIWQTIHQRIAAVQR